MFDRLITVFSSKPFGIQLARVSTYPTLIVQRNWIERQYCNNAPKARKDLASREECQE